METRITQCPRCGTSFRVTDALLAVAAGAVRCGSCLHIFNAREYWLDESKPESSPPTIDARPNPVAATTAESRREPTFDDDALFDDDTPLFDDDEPAEAASAGRSIFNPVDTDFVFDKDEADEKPAELANEFLDASDWLTPNPINFSDRDAKSDDGEELDESWAEDLLRDEPPKKPTPAEPPANLLAEADLRLERASVISDASDYLLDPEEILASVPETDNAQRATADDIILDLPSAYEPGLRAAPPTEAGPEPEPFVAAEIAADAPLTAGERNDDDLPPSLRGLGSAPIQRHQFRRESRWPALLWGFGLIVVLALLPAQYLYFNFDNLARGQLRPWLAQACGAIGCQLPPQSDPEHIRTGSLIVRSHPTVSGALAVDAIITNLAPFAQPYPELVLQFTDMEGKPVAGRRFMPNEYLAGELTGSRLMPIGQPIHIGLEVRDPGPKAVNYLLAVSPAQP